MSDLFADLPDAGAPPALDPRSRELAIRTVLGEAADEPPEGQAGVAAVIRNRMQSGQYGGSDVPRVVTAKNQFEPWNTQAGRERMFSYAPDSELYQRAGAAVDRVFGEGYDPTSGATHFYSPTTQAALGRQTPAWAQGEGQSIGRHTFFAPEGRVQVASNAAPGLFDDLPGTSTGQGERPPTGAAQPGGAAGGRFAEPLPNGGNFRVAREGESPQMPSGFMDKLVQLWENPPKDRMSLIGMVKSAYEGATLPGDVYSGKTPITDESGQTSPEVIQRSAQLAQAVPMGQAPGGVLARPSTVDEALLANAPRRPAAVPSNVELKTAAKAGFQAPEIKALDLQASAAGSFAQDTRSTLVNAGLDDTVAPGVHAVLGKLENAPDGGFINGQNLVSLRKTLGNMAREKQEGRPTPNAAAATQTIDALDNFVMNPPKGSVIAGDPQAASQVWQDARANYAAAMRSENIDKKVVQAELRAAAANSGQNVANTIRQRMAGIIISPKERMGYSADELAQMEKIVRGGIIDNALRGAGNLLGGGGGLGAVAAATAGGLATGGPGAIAPVIGYALKRLGNSMTLRQAEKLSAAVRERSPLANSMQDFGEKAAQLEAVPGPKSMAAVALASRNLANNMRDAGLSISAGDIIRGLQAPATGRADQPDENQ